MRHSFRTKTLVHRLHVWQVNSMCVFGFVSGLSIGDTPNQQHIGIVLTVLGVVVLDFCADAAEGPITAYLLDVADTDEQDMALNIHGLCAGKTYI